MLISEPRKAYAAISYTKALMDHSADHANATNEALAKLRVILTG